MNKPLLRKNAQSGFTLIELIVVIVILGILAATALPKFTSLGGDARYASLQAAKGALAATAAMAKGKFLVNTTGTALTELDIEGSKIKFTAGGYPQATQTFADAAGISADYHIIVGAGGGGANAPTVGAGEIAVVPMTVKDSPTAAKCYLIYAQPAAGAAPTYTMKGSAADCE
jgi:MSHA pilin protein MshA